MAAKKDMMIPSEKERKRALKYATPAGTSRMWAAMGTAFVILGIVLLLIPIGLAISEASASWTTRITQNSALELKHSPQEARQPSAK